MMPLRHTSPSATAVRPTTSRTLPSRRLQHQIGEMGHVHRLADDAIGAACQGVTGDLRRAVRAHQDNLAGWRVLFQCREQAQISRVGEPVVQEHDIERCGRVLERTKCRLSVTASATTFPAAPRAWAKDQRISDSSSTTRMRRGADYGWAATLFCLARAEHAKKK
jgi:hypothetical protein